MLPIRFKISFTVHKPNRLFPDAKDTSLGAELKRKRLSLEWTQKDTANYFNVLKDSYQNWEWNDYLPHIKNRKKINTFLEYNYWDDGTESLSNLVLCYRIEHELTMRELAEKIGNVSNATIERIEKNDDLISNEMKKKIINYLSVSK